MVKLLRLSVMPLFLFLLVSLVAAHAGDAQSTAGTPPPAGQTPPAGAPAAPPAPTGPPEAQALTAALRLANPGDRVAALEKIRTDFPQGSNLAAVDTQLLATLTTLPDRTTDTNVVIDRMLARIAPTATPVLRFNLTLAPAAPLIQRKVMLDRAEQLVNQAAEGMTFAKFAEAERERARTAGQKEPEASTLRTQYDNNFGSRIEYERGRVFAAKGDVDRAEQAFKTTLKLVPTNVPAVTAMVALYNENDRKHKIEAFLNDTLKAAPAHSGALGALATHYESEKKPDKAEAVLTTAYAAPNASPVLLSQLVAFYDRQQQPAKAEALLKSELAKAPTNATALNLIVTRYEREQQGDKAEAVLTTALKVTPVSVPALNLLLARYDRANTPDKKEPVLRDVLSRDAAIPSAWIALAKIEQTRGNDAKALDAYLQAGSVQYLRGPDLESLKTLYTKAHGNTDGLEAELHKRYLAMPKAAKATAYTPTAKRSDRLVVFEMFTGSGCPPCVAADLAMEAVMERYPAGTIIPIAYHVHIPAPDPMTLSEAEARRNFYGVTGVPTAEIDGAMVSGATGGNIGGGGRDRAPFLYDMYSGIVDKNLETPAEAALSVRGMVEGDTVSVTANVTKLPAEARDLRLHILLVEKELMFGGENGIRQHPVVVRGIAGEKGMGLPLAGTGATQHTFNLAAIREDITKFLASDIQRRRPAPLAPGAVSTFAAEGRAMTTIDTSHLAVIAFVQAADKKILQATQSAVAVGAPGSGGGSSTPGRAPAPTAPPAQGTTPPAPATPRPAPAPPPDMEAMNAAMRIADPAARLTALEKIRTDFPEAGLLSAVDQQMLSTLANSFPERLKDIETVFDRVLARIPASATPEARFGMIAGPVGVLVGKKLLLDRSEKLMTDAYKALDFDRFATAQRDLAKRTNRAEPTKDALETQFNAQYRGRAAEGFGRLALARGDEARAEAQFKESLKLAPNALPPLTALVDLYTGWTDAKKSEAALRSLLDIAPASSRARVVVPLARLEQKRGDDRAALAHYIEGAVGGAVRGSDHDAMTTLYARIHGKTDGLDAEIDAAYAKLFPNPVTPEPWKPTAARSNRLVLLEMFTGSACPPCVSADLAMDAVMERYGAAIIPLAYHVHIPGPDPMTTSGSETRRLFYGVTGVPTLKIDGEAATVGGGGARENTPATYNRYLPVIDKQLEAPAYGEVTVKAVAEGNDVTVTARVSDLPKDAKDVRLHLVLAEEHLSFSGENGIRFHPKVVRGIAGEKADGLPVAADGTFTWTFKLDAIRDDITKNLEANIKGRRDREPEGSTPRAYNAEGRAMTTIDPAHLVVVAYLQGADKKVLQAFQAEVSGPAADVKRK